MAKDKITEYDATANNNTVCGDVNIAENSALPSDMNNFAREIMSHLKEGLGSGTPLYVDQTNNRLGIGTSSPNSQITLKQSAQNFAGGLRFIRSDNTNNFAFAIDGNTKLNIGYNDSSVLLIDANGHVTMPNQPAFLAQLSTAQNNITPTTIANVVQFDTEIFDQNADFNTSTYTFTAPVTGKYQINAHLYLEYLDTGATYYYLEIDSSNRDIYHIIDIDKFSADLDSMSFTMSQLIDMDANDTVRIRVVQQSGTQQTDINAGSYFSGYLVA